jgi:hypothetical protein
MNAEKWKRINKIYHDVLKLKADRRRSFLDEACGGDQELRKEIEALITSHEKLNCFLESPAVAVAVKAIAADDSRNLQSSLPVRIVLTISKGPREGKTLVFAEHKRCIFGRSNDSFEILPEDDPTVGRHHFVLDINPPEASIRDLQSRNGTFVNGRDISGRKKGGTLPQGGPAESPATMLHHGDTIKAGGTTFTIGVELPVACASCGNPTGLCSPLRGEKGASVGICYLCWRILSREAAPQEKASSHAAPICIKCSLCSKDVTAEAGSWKRGEYLCIACRTKVAGNKKVLKRFLDTTSHPSTKEGIPSIKAYQFKKSLEHGNLGIVYLARDKSNKRDVTVKIVLSKVVADAASQAELFDRFEIIRNLRHPNLVEVLDYGSAGSAFYVVSEYCEGGNIRQILARRDNKLGMHEAIAIMMQALEGLAFVHRKGLHHGNLKPENLLLSGQEGKWIARLSDVHQHCSLQLAGFGDASLAERTDDLSFIPHEMLMGSGSASPSSDVWSMTAIFYYMLSGQLPQEIPGDKEGLASLVDPVFVPIRKRCSNITPELAQLVDDSLKLNPALRPQSASEMLERMKKIQARVVRLTLAQ